MPVPERTVGRVNPPYCRLQPLPHRAVPHRATPLPNSPCHDSPDLLSKRAAEGAEAPSAAVCSGCLAGAGPNQHCPTPSDRAWRDRTTSGFLRTQRRGPKPSALRSSALARPWHAIPRRAQPDRVLPGRVRPDLDLHHLDASTESTMLGSPVA
jgi:hypothetical protein